MGLPMSSAVEKLRRPVGLLLNFPLPMVESAKVREKVEDPKPQIAYTFQQFAWIIAICMSLLGLILTVQKKKRT